MNPLSLAPSCVSSIRKQDLGYRISLKSGLDKLDEVRKEQGERTIQTRGTKLATEEEGGSAGHRMIDVSVS